MIMADIKLLGISGSLRAGSFNRKLLREAARLAQGASLTEGDINLPLYNGDDEEASGIPASVQMLADQIASHDAVIISTPEYNKGISGALKNALDWVSRTKGGVWSGKPVAIMSATAGRSGGERAIANLRLALTPFRPRVLQGPDVLVGASFEQFGDDDVLLNELNAKALTDLMAALRAEVELVAKA